MRFVNKKLRAKFCTILTTQNTAENNYNITSCISVVVHRLLKEIPLQAVRVPGGCSFQISRQSAHENGKFVSLTQRPPLHPRKYSWYSFLSEADSIPGP